MNTISFVGSLEKNQKEFLRYCFDFKKKIDLRVCNFCGTEIKNRHYNILISHLRNCRKAPRCVQVQVMKRKEKKEKKKKAYNHETKESDSSCGEDENNNLTHDEIDVLVALFIFQSGLPVRLISGIPFHNLIESLVPGYKLKSPTHLMNKQLRELYLMEKEKMISKAKNAMNITLVTDGYSNVMGEHVVNFILCHEEDKPMYFGSVCTKSTSQTGAAIASDILKVMDEFPNISSLVTDNTAANINAWTIVEEHHPGLIAHGCLAHLGNLLLKDIYVIETNRTRLQECRKLSKFIKSHSHMLCIFRNCQKILADEGKITKKIELTIPCETRWYSSYNCMKCVYENKLVLETTFKTCESIARITKIEKFDEFNRKINNKGFWDDICNSVKKYEAFVTFIEIMEQDNCDFSRVYNHYRNLFNHNLLNSNDLAVLERRRPQFETLPVLVAHILEPNNKFIGPNSDQLLKCIDYLTAKCNNPLEVNNYMKFCTNPNNNRGTCGVRTWWHIFGQTMFPNLFKIALQILSISTSSAAAERIWSIFKFVHSPRRSSLTNEHADMLVFLYANSAIETMPFEEEAASSYVRNSYHE